MREREADWGAGVGARAAHLLHAEAPTGSAKKTPNVSRPEKGRSRRQTNRVSSRSSQVC